MSYKLTAADLTALKKEASMYAELKPGYRSWFPIETIPRALNSTWYTLNRVQTPAISMDGADYVGVRTARTACSVPVIWMRYKFHWDLTEVEAAQKAGVPLKADDAMVALQQIDNKIEQLIIEGIDNPDVINGLTENGTDVGATLDATMVATADSFITHASTAYNYLLTQGFAGPYHWIVSDTVAQYLGLPLGAGGGKSQGNYINETFGFKTFIERATPVATFNLNIEENTEETIFPMVYTADNGIWVCIAANPANMALQQVAPPTFSVNPVMDRDTNKYYGYVEWQGTVRTSHATAACFMEDVDSA